MHIAPLGAMYDHTFKCAPPIIFFGNFIDAEDMIVIVSPERAFLLVNHNGGRGNRTLTPLQAQDFKSRVSTVPPLPLELLNVMSRHTI